ncbi:ech hydrogenase subunit D [Methanolinea mesophila]|uniref:NADH-quinone oxidoreductase subunit C n=1 Tax=Methanolinea mesophila TaxID=547055 RepID=UPI001AE82801|nr:NADH-quinone oxidoreductase subunit C [Methanolinea mesophila]MBP1927511.1 ech hydrogenase subunit D [Methanolinea mesophila]
MKIEEQNTADIELGALIGRVEALKEAGFRLVQIHCTKLDDRLEINYSFDRNYEFQNLRINVGIETEIPSISGMYWGSFAYENEMHDLFGVQVKGMNIDFHGTFIRTAKKYPFREPEFRGEGPCQER